jgi:hypothetical protein
MKTVKLFTLALCALYLMACEKERGPEKTLYPQTYVYAGIETHPSKYYQWNGGNSFTELPDVQFPEYYDDAEFEKFITEVYDLFYPFLEFSLESDSLMRLKSRETEDFPALDTTTSYQNTGNALLFLETEIGDQPYTWYFSDDFSRIKSRGYVYNYTYYNTYFDRRDYFAMSIEEGTRLEKTEMELLDLIVAENQNLLQPNDTIQLKLFEVVHELQ